MFYLFNDSTFALSSLTSDFKKERFSIEEEGTISFVLF